MDEKEADELRKAAHAFVGAAFDVLKSQHVLPTPVFHPFVQVGRDFYGPDVSGLQEYHELELLLTKAFPERFTDPTNPNREYASMYAFRLVESAVARCGSGDDEYVADSEPVVNSIDELLHVLGEEEHEVLACRFVSHLTTASGEPLEFGDIQVIPDSPLEHGFLISKIAELIPGTWASFNREEPRIYDPPHAILVATGTVPRATGGYDGLRSLSNDIDDFLLLIRLLTAGTVESYYEVAGFSTLIAPWSPLVSQSTKGLLDGLLRRTARLSEEHRTAFEQLRSTMTAVDVQRQGMATTSLTWRSRSTRYPTTRERSTSTSSI